eukprot:3936533-Rhodomonas_salina.1
MHGGVEMRTKKNCVANAARDSQLWGKDGLKLSKQKCSRSRKKGDNTRRRNRKNGVKLPQLWPREMLIETSGGSIPRTRDALSRADMRHTAPRFTAGEMSDKERSLWNFKLKLDTFSKAKLVDLCKANSIAGSHAKTKPELAWILMKIKHHGGPGHDLSCPTFRALLAEDCRCPTCLQRSGSRSQTANGLAFSYPEDTPPDDILAIPEVMLAEFALQGLKLKPAMPTGRGVHCWRHSVPAQVHVQSFCPAACSKLEGHAGRELYSEGIGVKARSSALRYFWTDSLQS